MEPSAEAVASAQAVAQRVVEEWVKAQMPLATLGEWFKERNSLVSRIARALAEQARASERATLLDVADHYNVDEFVRKALRARAAAQEWADG